MASAKSGFRRVHTGTREGDAMQRQAQETARAANAHPTNGARLIDTDVGGVAGKGLTFSSGVPRSIPHGLGRKATGFIEAYGVDVPSPSRVGLFPSAHPGGITSDTHITVTADLDGTCFILVF